MKIESRGKLALHFNYLTGDFKIPAIRVFAYPKNGPYLDSCAFYTSLGVHPDRKIALTRALTELIQSRAASLYRIKNNYDIVHKQNVFPTQVFSYFNDVIDRNKILSFDKLASYENEDILKDIELVIDVLHKKGCEVIIKDLTHPDIGVPTVRVIVKGLQPGIFGIGIMDINHKVARISSIWNAIPISGIIFITCLLLAVSRQAREKRSCGIFRMLWRIRKWP